MGMPYGKRNADGKICAVSIDWIEGFEHVGEEGLAEFYELAQKEAQQEGITPPDAYLRETDAKMARVVEDLVALLIEHGVIEFEEIPKPARSRIAARRISRTESQSIKMIAEGDEEQSEAGEA